MLVATARELPTLAGGRVELDALVHSGTDLAERYEPGQLDPPPKLVVTTMGREGGEFVAGEREGTYAAAELPGPVADAYGAGDSFAAGLAFALGRGDSVEEALAVRSRLWRGSDDDQRRLRLTTNWVARVALWGIVV